MTDFSSAKPVDQDEPMQDDPGGHRVAIVVQLPFARSDYLKFGVSGFIDMGWMIDVIDVSSLLHPNTTFEVGDTAHPAQIAVHAVRSEKQLQGISSILDRASAVLCGISTGHITKRSMSTMRVISRSQTPYFLIYREAIPSIDSEARQRSALQRLRQIDLTNSILNRLPLSLLGLRAADAVIWGGTACRTAMRLVRSSTTELWASSQNFEQYQEEVARQEGSQGSRTAVYIDQYFGFHPDAQVRGAGHGVRPENYYPHLCRLFERIEQELGLDIVIARHPRADYRDKPELFGGRKIVADNTIGLVRRARLVVTAYSTAAAYAVLFGKPLLVITTPEISSIRALPGAPEALAKAIGARAHDISIPIELTPTDALKIDANRYRSYVEKYIVADRESWRGIAEIVGDFCGKAPDPR